MKSEIKRRLETLGVDGKIILKFVFKTQDGRRGLNLAHRKKWLGFIEYEEFLD